MQRGQKKSPFIGKSEPTGASYGPILYQRYSDVTDILIGGALKHNGPERGSVPGTRENVKQPGNFPAADKRGVDRAADNGVHAGVLVRATVDGAAAALTASGGGEIAMAGVKGSMESKGSKRKRTNLEAGSEQPLTIADSRGAAAPAGVASNPELTLGQCESGHGVGQEMKKQKKQAAGSAVEAAGPSAKAAVEVGGGFSGNKTAQLGMLVEGQAEGVGMAAGRKKRIRGADAEQQKGGSSVATPSCEAAPAAVVSKPTAKDGTGLSRPKKHERAKQGVGQQVPSQDATCASGDAGGTEKSDMGNGSQPQANSAMFDPQSPEYYTPAAIAERKRLKREKRAKRRSAVVPDGEAAGERASPEQAAPGEQGDVGHPDSVGEDTAGRALKRSKKGKETELVSGPGNAAEALAFREKFGYVKGSEPETKPHAFVFGFSPGEGDKLEPSAAMAGLPEGGSNSSSQQLDGSMQPDEQQVTAGGEEAAGGAEVTERPKEVDAVTAERLRRVMGVGPNTQSVARRVFVGGMPFGYEEEEVREFWSYCGEIESLDLMRFPDSGRFKGIAFITFATDEGYQEALKCDGTMVEGVRLKVERCKSAASAPKSRAPKYSGEGPRLQHSGAALKTAGYLVAYVGNVAFEADASQLSALFEGCKVTRVRLHTDKDTGRPKGFAHVHFLDEESLDRAMTFNGAELHGRAVKVGYAQLPKKAEQS